ncbi:MAG: AhpC/TSA family protein [Bacteroidales bacterium]|nr:AhpC/TSA family protein [Bacteroidales bacterium]
MNKVFYMLAAVVFMAACSSEPHYVVKGKISGSDSVTFYLQKKEAGKTVTIDSALSKKGSFTFKKGYIDYPQLVQFVAGSTKMRTSFYLENSEISITGSLDSLFNAKITGSKTQDEYRSFIEMNKPLSEQYSDIFLQYQNARHSDDAAKAADLEKRADSVQTEIKNLKINFIKNNPSSYVSPSLIGSLRFDMEAAEIESMINGLDTAVISTPQVKELKEHVALMKTVSVGQKAPDFTMNNVEGTPVSLSSKIGSKLLLIDFWASWCGPCRQENPNVVKVYNEFHKKGFDVFGVSLDQKKEAWAKAITDDKLTWTHVSDLQYWGNAAAKQYAIFRIPSNFLLDETGTIIGRNLTGEDLYQKVSEVLGK